MPKVSHVSGSSRSIIFCFFFCIILINVYDSHTEEIDYHLWLRNPGPDRHTDATSTPIILTDINVSLPCMVPKDNAMNITIRSGTIKASFNDHLSHFNSGTYGHQSIRKGQSLEDAFIYEKYFFGYSDGLIVESGALDGVTFSNTFLFDKFANWTAVHVEADPVSYGKLTENRGGTAVKSVNIVTQSFFFAPLHIIFFAHSPLHITILFSAPFPHHTIGSINIHAGLCNISRKLHFTNTGNAASRGFVEFMAPGFLADWHAGLIGNMSSLPVVQCVPMHHILRALNITHVDVWIVDLEGSELMALQGTNFHEVHFNLVVIECTHYDKERNLQVMAYMKTKSFHCERVRNNCYCPHDLFNGSR